MEVILLERIEGVGNLGDIVSVKNGYARNFLIPYKKAVLATEDAKSKIEEKRNQLMKEEGQRLENAKARAEIAIKEISLTRLCGEKGQLYGSVSSIDIAKALTKVGTTIEKSEVFLPNGTIKHVGEFKADVILHPEVRFTVTVIIKGEESKVHTTEKDT